MRYTQDKELSLKRHYKLAFFRPIPCITRWMFIACLILACFATGADAKQKAVPQTPSFETLHPKSMDDVNQLLSKLSDEQVRQILIQQLAKSLPAAHKDSGQSGGMNRLESFSILFQQRLSELGRYLPQFFSDMAQIVQKVTDGEGLTALLRMFIALAVIIALALGVERICRRFSSGMRERFDAAPVMHGFLRFGTSMMRILPDFLGIAVFTLTSGLLYAVIPFSHEGGRLVFIAAMMIIVLIRLITLLSRLIWSPDAAQLRLTPVSDATASHLHRNLTWLAGYFVCIDIFLLFLQKLGTPINGIFLVMLVLSIPFMGMMRQFLWHSRTIVADHLRQTGQGPSGEVSWFRDQMASGWHMLAMGYVSIVWLLAIGRFALYGPQNDQAFVVSFLIIPLYMIMARAGKWLVTETLGTIRKTGEEAENTRYFTIAIGLVRLVIVFTLVLWLLNIWAIDLPFIQKFVHTAFSILVTLILAHMIWGQTNRYIQQKLLAMAPPATEKKEDGDEEFSGVVLDRSFTLLPMLRKFLGTVLVVMVTLIVLSSLGIDIAPLMAGAGVVGLAIGFGAQKLVADVLSGIFYLVDDAFRVGEYIQASSVSGTVEGFTLRNMMLRHHRGALQIVPFSKLGAITNYMRGGMVMKFNLELPYDTDVNQVRKVIKKVNQKVMEDPELGPDLIQPIKSQGIKKVADSVMTFRVKFTAKPGKQFVIQRQAFKLIADALAKKGIQFAHRRVIVELPPGLENASDAKTPGTAPAPEVVEPLKAGAAAALTRMLVEEEQEREALAKKKK
jgi:small-conductance mechanosensitive channel